MTELFKHSEAKMNIDKQKIEKVDEMIAESNRRMDLVNENLTEVIA